MTFAWYNRTKHAAPANLHLIAIFQTKTVFFTTIKKEHTPTKCTDLSEWRCLPFLVHVSNHPEVVHSAFL